MVMEVIHKKNDNLTYLLVMYLYTMIFRRFPTQMSKETARIVFVFFPSFALRERGSGGECFCLAICSIYITNIPG